MLLEGISAFWQLSEPGEEGTRSKLYKLARHVVYSLDCSIAMMPCYNCLFYVHSYIIKFSFPMSFFSGFIRVTNLIVNIFLSVPPKCRD